MPNYYVNRNAQSNGDNEVHEDACNQGAALPNRVALGYHASCVSAVAMAKRTYPRANGCAYCSPACHTS